jgi:D-glycero-D-manno-heptose 1,7-bisphosphate phosphatase
MNRRAVFLDRDGTLMVDVGYPRDPAQVQLLPGVAEGLAACREAGYLLAIISNQSGVGRGYFGPEAVAGVHRQLLALLAERGITVDDAQYCLHAPEDRCDCRKPSPRMILRSAERLGADLQQSFMVGDKPSDVEAGRLAGCRTILLRDDRSRTDPGAADFVARDWDEVANRIRESSASPRESGT